MKKVGIVTISDYTNYGNRLQNYALYKYLKNYNLDVETIQNIDGFYNDNKKLIFKQKIKDFIKRFLIFKISFRRYLAFANFNKNIKFSAIMIDKDHISSDLNKYYDYFVVGSDQVWNPTFGRMSDIDLLNFASSEKRISYAASIAVDKIPKEDEARAKEAFNKFKKISVREDKGKEIVENLTGRKDVEVLVDPTLLLDSLEWEKLEKKPKKLKNKYIFTYFLGDVSKERKKEIENFALKNECELIDILDCNSKYYDCGPSEFLYLINHAFLVCTDSFHASVFSLIFNKPFVVYNREQKNCVNMNSRIETLLNKFDIMQRKYNGKLSNDILKYDYSNAYKKLKEERVKTEKFIKDALDI